MTYVYSTEQLIQILADERQACIRGQRLDLSVSPSGFSPCLDLFLQPDGIQKFTAYSQFREAVHQYQRDHHVSGLVWHSLTLQGRSLSYPKINDQLISLPEDLEVLKQARDTVVAFWREATIAMDLYQSLSDGKSYRRLDTAAGDRIIARTEWATLCYHGRETRLEVILQLGWGRPEEADYRRGLPDSGSEYLHAVQPGHYPLG